MRKGEKRKQQKAMERRSERRLAQRRLHPAADRTVALIRQARSFALEGCWTMQGWQENGLTIVVVARRQPNDLLAYGVYLVDYYCLGVKSTLAKTNVLPGRFYGEALPELLQGPSVEIEPDLAHELIYGSIEFAARYGFHPPRDFKLSQSILDPPDAHPLTGTLEFGKDGKPFYVSGPRDNVQAIMRQLTRTAGEGNFEFLAHLEELPEGLEPDDNMGDREN